ncbi:MULTISPECIES: toll/interleukin-1 receptor domain-containing protein [unclassified Streptomyces]|uniref:tetratricopeptide repeat protein n=1 Tax=unclassified Streptomyces TaxID=2593676 RepID=UPI000DDB6B17|nr:MULTISPECIES: toll/interleukin-1 receptor domain-containing protein [unclassified Streptomyces]QZZ27210.1 toll/interleukin-1 receptor domain-containing protein [Streptomyces sp. ST1015]
MWDVFLSYSRADVESVRPLARALREEGLRVFTDETGVAPFEGISETIRRELGRSTALLAYYSTGYPAREACQWELTCAYLAGLAEGDPRRRVMVANPEPAAAHIQPVELRDARHADPADPAGLVADVVAHLARLDGPMRLPEPAVRGPHPEFLGRLTELWQVHSALHAHAAPLTAGRAPARTVQIRGMAGIGKTALAREYALRFAAAYPGGVHWLDGRSDDTPVRDPDPGGPFLLIVDDVPPGRLAETTAQHPLGHTLFTLRGHAYGGPGAVLDLGPLDAHHARVLLGGNPDDRDDSGDFGDTDTLAEAVDGHPLALALLGRAVRAGHSPRALYDLLHTRGRSLLDTLAERDVTAGLVADVDGDEAADVLRCAAALHPLPVTARDAAGVLAAVDRVPQAVARRRAAQGIAELSARGLLEPESAPGGAAGAWRLHPVTLHAWHHHDPAPARTEALRHAALRMLCGHRGPDTLGLPGSRREVPVTAPSESERMAAFDIQVELVTRIGVQELAPGEGSLREALSSLKSVIDFTRATLHTYSIGLAPGTGARTVQSLAYSLVNDVIRPFTTAWHPRLTAYEATRPASVSPLDHEAGWAQGESMRAELAALRGPLQEIVEGLGGISGAGFGLAAAG